MKARFLAAAAIALVSAPPLAAQANTCPAGTTTAGIPDRQRATQDACQIGVDVFQLLAPQLGVAMTGGNATLGQGGTLGGLGHFSVGVRANVLAGDIPDVDSDSYNPSITGRQPSRTLETKTQALGLPAVDAAIGIFKGIPLGLTNIGGVDLLLSAAYVPSIGTEGEDAFVVAPESNLKIGYGARVGLLQESLIVPGVSVTYLKRDLPRTSIFASSSDIDLAIRDVSVETTAFRVVASKSLLFFGLAAGVGQDKYDQSAVIQATTTQSGISATSDEITLSQDLTRTNYFVDVSLNLPFIKVVGEIGQVTGGSLPAGVPYNTFSSGGVTQSRTYGSVGLRIGF